MPIYEYRCSNCGHQQEFLQKLSDPTLTVCPNCGQATFSKMLSAAGFQLKGSGWYATDFRNSGAKPSSKSSDTSKGESKSTSDAKPDAKPAAAETKPATTSTKPTPTSGDAD